VWDSDGDKADMPETEIFYFGFGLEYGFTNWFSTVFDWKGWNIWSDDDGPPEKFEEFHGFRWKRGSISLGDRLR
jgi:hypothetical protein